ncbi:MAG: chemotaxis protein CheB [Pseudomonadota bacterium]
MPTDRMDNLKVIIADPDPGSAELLVQLCYSINGLNFSGIARSEQMLVAKIRSIHPDLIFLRLTPDTGGIAVIDTLKKINPDLNVIIVYPHEHDPDSLVTALEAGAYDCFEQPLETQSRQFNEFRLHLLTATGLLRSRKRFFKQGEPDHKNKFFKPRKKESRLLVPMPPKGRVEVVAIAASTGGPEILSQIFSILPKGLNVPILLVQHIPADMTQFFAKSLNKKSELDIAQAKAGDLILPSRVYVAPGGQHMVVSKADDQGQRRIQLNNKPLVNSVRPSADVLFESIAQSYDGNVLAIILTGMGEDGRHGVVALKEKTRCFCVSQEAATCVVYGMPRAVDEAGLSDECLDPLSITQKIVMSVW